MQSPRGPNPRLTKSLEAPGVTCEPIGRALCWVKGPQKTTVKQHNSQGNPNGNPRAQRGPCGVPWRHWGSRAAEVHGLEIQIA